MKKLLFLVTFALLIPVFIGDSLLFADKVANGLIFKKKTIYITESDKSKSPVQFYILEVSPRKRRLEVNLGEDKINGREKLSDMVKRKHAIAGINADFYTTEGPQGGIKVKGQWRSSVKGHWPNVIFRQYNNKTLSIAFYDHTPAGEMRKAYFACSGSTIILDAGKPVLKGVTSPSSFAYGRHPRTIIARKPNGTIGLIVVDGRQKSSVGLTLQEASKFLLKLGYKWALNLDGGGSSTIVIRGKIMNNPSDGQERVFGSCLLVY